MSIDLLHNECKHPIATLVLAHGAGAPMDHPFMSFFATELADRDVHVVRFEFPYMAARRTTGKRSAPDRQPVLLACWRDVIEQLTPRNLFIGGKSLGGRMASMVADDAMVTGLICLGYPFHPPGKPENPRTQHLTVMSTPTLIVQGERDTFGTRAEVEGYSLSEKIQIHFSGDGDHGLKPRKASGLTEEDNWRDAVRMITKFIQTHAA